MTETIFALSSGTGLAGVAVLRISGPLCKNIISLMAGEIPAPRLAVLRLLKNPYTEEILDRGLVLFFPAPDSFTGEDVAEFHVHGGRAVIEACLETLLSIEGTRIADSGEFTRRAFDNGKMDLTQVEGLADLIAAKTEAQRRQALRVTTGEARRAYERWRKELIGCLAYFEADIDFVDEDDVPENLSEQVHDRIKALTTSISDNLDDPRLGEKLRDGYRVVISGVPNVGKSTLLNRLVRRDAAIVSDIAGTTRDVVEVYLDLDGFPVIFSDTAGLRESSDTIETIGMARARNSITEADLIIWLSDERDLWPRDALEGVDSEALWISNKADIDSGRIRNQLVGKSLIMISAKNDDGISELLDLIVEKVRSRSDSRDSVIITRRRHREALKKCVEYLSRAEDSFTSGSLDYELLAEDLRLAVREIGRITGRVDVEDLLDVIFSDFCIGK